MTDPRLKPDANPRAVSQFNEPQYPVTSTVQSPIRAPARGGGTNKKTRNSDPFPLINETQTPMTDISSSSSDSAPESSVPRPTRSRAKKLRKSAHETLPTVPSLRPAKDVLSRIRHDPDLGGEDQYVVGYLDRHEKDPLEMNVSEWKAGDVTDEEWIPQHRILYFRRKGEGQGLKVWDRAKRLDRVFGSGVVVDDEVGQEEKRDVGGGSEGLEPDEGPKNQIEISKK